MRELFYSSLFFIICFFTACGDIEENSALQTEDDKGSSVASSNENAYSDWDYLPEEVFFMTAVSTEDVDFLIAQEVSISGKTVKTKAEDANLLLELLQNTRVTKQEGFLSYADYYLLLRDKNGVPQCLIEVWEGFICINSREYYKTYDDELFAAVSNLLNTSIEVDKVSPEDILLSMPIYSDSESDEREIIVYNDKPAILIETGYHNVNSSEEEYYYERLICYGGLYFDTEFQTTYMFVQNTIYYNDDGSVYDSYYKRDSYYDYFTGERIIFPY